MTWLYVLVCDALLTGGGFLGGVSYMKLRSALKELKEQQ